MNTIIYKTINKIIFKGEKWKILSHHYPKRIVQRKLDKKGIVFLVGNITEANRIRNFDNESEFIKQLMTELTFSDVFYDLGACIGLYSLHAARRSQAVVAFEPEPEIRKHLVSNIELNELSNIMVLPYALSDVSKITYLYTDGVSGKSPSLQDLGFKDQITVRTLRLDDVVYIEKVKAPDVIKIDVEGAEVHVLKGMKLVMEDHPPRAIFIEVHPKVLPNFGSSEQEVHFILEKAGYKLIKQSKRDDQFHYIYRH